MKSKVKQRAGNQERPFPIVVVGASAGGLAPFERFLSVLPRKFGFALIFMQHLSPEYKNLLPDLLRSRAKSLEIEEVSDGLDVLTGKVYLCPPASEVRIEKGALRVVSRTRPHLHLPIDELLVSLSEDSPERAIAVILSGSGTDGARGVQAVKTRGGTVFVQDPAGAEYPDMPLSAINTGQVDGVLSPDDMAREILKFQRSGKLAVSDDRFMTAVQLDSLYQIVNDRTGSHFNHYKSSVVARRVRRRMYLQGINAVDDYLGLLAQKEQEARDLASDILIGVTSFFRDRLAWKALHLEVTRKLAVEETATPIRVWAAACATGEEAYSIAMMLDHELDAAGRRKEFQVFATDVNDLAMQRAREGRYPASISADLPPEYLQSYFSPSNEGLSATVNKEIRQRVIFARHDLLIDPPFSRLDLIICRNLLIYLDPDAQEKCIALFHYALKKGGYLFLGNAESPGRTSTLFATLAHKKCRIYRKAEGKQTARMPLSIPFGSERPSSRPKPEQEHPRPTDYLIQETLLEEYAPAAVAINQNHDIVYNNGPTNRFLRPPRGTPTQNLLELLPEKLRNRVRGALHRTAQDGKPVTIRASSAVDELKKQVFVRVSKVRENLFLITFREGGSPIEEAETPDNGAIEQMAVHQLEHELAGTRDELQSHIEELRSVNEELESSNEELQAANEELETSREELQSLNEELTTVNAQLQTKIEEQEETNNDLNNFLTSTNIPTIFLDHRSRVKRFTPAMSRLITLIPADVGRSIMDMSRENLGPDLIEDARSVLDNLAPIRRELSIGDAWYVRTILPYRTGDNRIEGVVVTYVDITERVQAEKRIRHLASFPEINPNPIVEVDRSGRVIFYNPAAQTVLETAGLDGKEAAALLPPDMDALLGGWDGQIEIMLNREVALGNRVFDEAVHLIPGFNVARIYGRDITARKQAEEAHAESQRRLGVIVDSIADGFFALDREWRITHANDAALIHFGRKRDEVVGRLFAEVFPEARGTSFEIEYRRAMETGESVHFESVSLLSEKALEVHAYPGPDNVTVIFRDVSERIKMQNALRESEQRVRLKLDSILTPEGDIGSLELADIIDVPAIQSLMDEFNTLAPIPMAILDMKGRVLVAKGWQDICTKFHRVHPETCAHCVESDLVLSAGVPPGESRLYKCKNNMWDIATPILIGGHQMGNLFAGQFFFEEEPVDYEVFRSQARVYGFDEEEYVAALDAVPRLARETVERGIAFLMKLSHMISQLSYSNVKLARSMAQSEALAGSLRESEERHRSLFQNLLDAYCYCQMVFDEGGRPVDYVFLEVNEAFAAMSGYEDVVGKKATEVIPGVREAHPEMFEAYGRVAMTGQPERFEIHFTPTGRWFTVQAHSVRKGYVAIIFENITERKRSQSRIAALARLYAVLSRVNETIVRVRDEQSLFDGVCGIVAEVGGFPLVWIGLAKDGWVVPVASCGEDSGYLRDIRIRVEGDLGRGPTGTCIRENRAVINDDFETNPSTLPWREQALTHGFHASAAFPVRRRGKAVGAFTLYAFEPNTFDSEQVSLLESLSADISYALDAMDQERLRGETEEALRENQARLETVFAAIPDAILEYDTDGMPVRANEAALRAVGLTSLSFTRDKAVAKLKFRNLDAGAVKTDDLPTSRALRGETVAGDLYTIETADRVDRVVSTYAVPLYKDGSVNGVVALWHDVSELKRSEEALRRAHDELEKRVQERTAELQQAYDKLLKEEDERRQLEEQLRQAQKMEALGTLTGGIAHDFNNILAAMIGFTEIVRDHAPEESREKHHLERVLEAGLRGRELIKRMLAFSRKTEQEKKRILLSTVVKETMKFVRSSTPSTISIRVSANGESRMVFADPVQMQQVVLNLCTNAIQAMQEKGGLLEVELSERTVSESDGGPHGMKPGPYVKLVVRDTGKGISRDIIDRIFDPFFTTKKVGEGTGLGLSVVHGIVHQHEGYISVESEEGKGSTFTVSLPAVEAALPEKGVAEQSAPMGSERILFVDDEELLAEMGKEILEDLGYEVIATTSSAEALALFKSEPGRFDLVITDVTMPEITGVELAREILSLRPDMPIIMCTGFSHLVNPDTAKAAGIKAFAMKPLTKREIARTIRHVLGE